MRAVREWMGREKQPFRELVKLFFRRFLENGLICLDGDTKPALVNILALLAAPGIFLPVLELLAYAAAYQRPFYVRDMASIPEKALYLCFSMTALGIATVLSGTRWFRIAGIMRCCGRFPSARERFWRPKSLRWPVSGGS